MCKIVVGDTVLVQVSNFQYLGYNVSYITNNDVVKKLHKFNNICGTIKKTLKSTSKETRLKVIGLNRLLAHVCL